MSKPAILTVDDDPMVSAAIGRDLLARYGADYRVVRATSGAEALDLLARLALRDDPVAMIVADQRMPRMTGHRDARAGARARAGREAPAADRLRGHRRRDHRDQRHRARLLPDEAVGPARRAALPGRRRPARRLAAGPPRADLRRARGRPPVVRPQPRDQDVPDPQPRPLPLVRRRAGRRGDAGSQHLAQAQPADLPLVLVPDGETLRSPSTLEVAGALGLHTSAQRPLYDLCIVGGGPAGLAAGRVRRVGGSQHRHRRARGARAARPARAPRSRTTSASRAA